jgi:hypothetical protein
MRRRKDHPISAYLKANKLTTPSKNLRRKMATSKDLMGAIHNAT